VSEHPTDPVIVRKRGAYTVDERVAQLEARVAAMDGGTCHAGRRDGGSLPDISWTCPKCKSILGFWDPITERMRIRLRDGYLWITQPSAARSCGARIEETCRNCGEINRWPS
jgi:hypothetical protein